MALAKKVLLISEKQVKELSVLEQNIDSKILSKVIVDAQNLNLKPVLGIPLYNRVIDTVYSASTISGFTINDTTKELISDYITPFLVYSVLVDFIVTNNYKLTNKGTLKLSDNNASNLSSDELEYAKNYYDNKMAAYKTALINYLTANKLIEGNTDKDVTSTSIGWFLDSPYNNPEPEQYLTSNAEDIGGGGGSPVSGGVFDEDITVVLANNKTFGKYVNGDVIPANGKTANDVIKLAAIEYINPVFTSFGTDISSTVEAGTLLTGSHTFTWHVNAGSGSVPVINILDRTQGSYIVTNIVNDDSADIVINDISLGDGDTQVFQVIATDTHNGNVFSSSTVTITGKYRIYYGVSDIVPNSVESVTILNSRLTNAGNTFSFPTGTDYNVFVVCLPPNVNLESVIDTSALNFDLTSLFAYYESFIGGDPTVINDAGGNPVEYRLYVYQNNIPYTISHNLLVNISINE